MQKISLLITTAALSLPSASARAEGTDFGAAAERVEMTMLLLIPLVALLAFSYMLRLASQR